MPYTYKKIGCTKTPIKKYPAVLHANVSEADTHQLKNSLKRMIYEVLNEGREGVGEKKTNVIMRTRTESGKMEDILNRNVGVPFDAREKEEILFLQGGLGVKSTILKNGTEIKFSTSDMFGNNKINMIKKLKNMSDQTTVVYANFYVVVQTTENKSADTQPQAQPQPQLPENPQAPASVTIKLSQPFDDRVSEKLTILGDLFTQLDT
jgi:hypothetical protein